MGFWAQGLHVIRLVHRVSPARLWGFLWHFHACVIYTLLLSPSPVLSLLSPFCWFPVPSPNNYLFYCCYSSLRFRSARNPMAGEELQPRGRTLTQEAGRPGVPSTVPEWLEEGSARGSKGCFVFWVFFCYPFPVTPCHPASPLALPLLWTFVLPLSLRIAGRAPTRQLKSFAIFTF